MITKSDKNKDRQKRHLRIRKDISGTAVRPRLNVFKSNKHIYAQIIDDERGATVVAASTLEKDIAAKTGDLKGAELAKLVGEAVAKKAINSGVNEVVFDRGGYLYTGRVAALAEGARGAGLKF